MRKIMLLFISLMFFIISVLTSIETDKKVVEEVVSSTQNSSIVVYFPRLPDFKLAAEKFEIENSINSETKIHLIIEKLISGSDKANLIDVIPIGSKINKIDINENIAIIDFSKEFVENHPGGSLGEYNTIYSIVNSVTEIDGIDQVIFLIDGQKQSTYKGHCQFDMPIIRDESLIITE